MFTFALTFVALAQQGLTPPPRPAPDAVLATVDGAPITAAEVEPYLWAWKTREVVADLAAHRIIAAEAARKGIGATDAEVKARIDEELKGAKAQLKPGQTLEEFVALQPGGMSRLAIVARSRVLIDKLAELEYKPDAFVKLSFLSFQVGGDGTDQLAAAIKSADAAYAALQAGKAWEAVLKANGADAATVASGGRPGWFPLSTLPESVQKQLAALKPSGYTKPVQIAGGIQIFRLVARGSEATPAELAELHARFLAGQRQAIVARLRQAAKVEYK